MVTANDLKGIMAMMPAFTTKDGDPRMFLSRSSQSFAWIPAKNMRE
jgi:hypothetical protein